MTQRILIVGGVAGGASCAARLRRLDERAEIVVFEKGPQISFANCGLPYYVGNIIQKREQLLVATPKLFKERFNIDARVRHEVTRIHPAEKRVEVKNLDSGETSAERYDALVLAPGGEPLRPPIPGIDLPGVFEVRTVPDVDAIQTWIDERQPQRAVVVGGGFIGLEAVENLARRGMQVTLLEKFDRVLPPLDPELAEIAHAHLKEKGVELRLQDGVQSFGESGAELVVTTDGGARLDAGIVVLAIGQRPNARLAAAAGLQLGESGGIAVDAQMRTSDSAIWAVGDAVESPHAVLGRPVVLPLAGPANRQGRIAAEAICGRDTNFRGVQGTWTVGVFDYTFAQTGPNERALQAAGVAYEKVFLHMPHHASYYPGAEMIHFKLLFSPGDGRVLGAQAAGKAGVTKRIDIVAMALQLGGTVHDLAQAELCYAPQYGSAKDPVNVAGLIARNHLNGDSPLVHFAELIERRAADGDAAPLVIDVRTPKEHGKGCVPGAVNVPLDELRGRLDELPRDREIWCHCGIGQRSYYAVRVLRQNGFDAKNLSGGLTTWQRGGYEK